MNWEDIQLFEAAATSGSLTAGARALGISQPQMSRRLRELEQKFGARLFDRTPQGLRPTGAGARLLPLASSMRLAADAVLRLEPDLKTDAISVVRLSVDEIRERFLTLHLGQLLDQLPDLEIEIFSRHEHPDHESRMTDIQIRSCLPDSDTLVARKFGQTQFSLYAASALYEEIKGLPLDELRDQPWIGIAPDYLWYPLQKKWLDDFFSTPSSLRFNTMKGILEAARSGAGLAMLPCFMAQEFEDLHCVIDDEAPVTTTEYIIVHRDLLREKAIRQVIDALVAVNKNAARGAHHRGAHAA